MPTPERPPETRVILVRHGESVGNATGTIMGQATCAGLSEQGRVQVERLRDRLAAFTEDCPDALVTSAFLRARQTAAIINEAVQLDLVTIAEFGEREPGPECDGKTFDELTALFGPWSDVVDPFTEPTHGETFADLFARVGAALSQLVNAYQGKTVMVVCHGGVIAAAMRVATHTGVTGGFDLHTKNASMTDIVHCGPNHWRIGRYNDHAHLGGMPTMRPWE